MTIRALVTGFEVYGRHGANPSTEVARALDGATVGEVTIVGRVLPVALAGLARRLERLLAEVQPDLVVATGLAPGESAIRLERLGVNLADFTLPDNRGRVVRDRPLVAGGPDAIFATLPLRGIEGALRRAGIPVRLSATAGLYLCNATLYRLLAMATAPCGFIHLPCLPEQAGSGEEDEERAPRPSMALATMIEAVRIAVAVSARRRPRARRGATRGTGRRA
jgi:pyroglutamyl-peptidase